MSFSPSASIGSWPRNILSAENSGIDSPKPHGRASQAIKEVRKKGAVQAARDVVRLLPMASLHVSNGCYFCLVPTVDNPEPKIAVYRVGINKEILPNSSTLCCDVTGRETSLESLQCSTPLVQASQEEILSALQEVDPGLGGEWIFVNVNVMGFPRRLALLRVSWVL